MDVWPHFTNFTYFTLSPLSQVLRNEIIDISEQNLPLQISVINTTKLMKYEGPHVTITIPLPLLRAFDEGDGLIRIVSAVYRNVENVFSDELDAK